jgi:hypothetical protein
MARPEHVIRLAQQRLVHQAAQLEIELQNNKAGYFYPIYKRFQNAAAEAIAAVAFVDPTDVKAIEALQCHIKVYDRFVEEVRDFLAQGKALYHEINEQERLEILDLLIAGNGEAEAADLGLIDRGPTD